MKLLTHVRIYYKFAMWNNKNIIGNAWNFVGLGKAESGPGDGGCCHRGGLGVEGCRPATARQQMPVGFAVK